MSANVTKYEVSKVQIPSIFESEDRGLDRCASPQLVLASLSSNSRYKNDITKIAVVCDVLTVELERSNGTIIAAPGLVVDFPHQSNAKGFVIDWRQLSTILPSGATVIDTDCYKIKISFEIAGTEGSYYYGAYRLKTWSIEVARNTVQVFSILNDVVRDDGINYRDSGFGGTIRFEGSFGYMQPNFDTKNLTYSDRSRKKVRNEALRTYELRTSYVTNCITEELDNDHLLAANQIWVTEHNPVAHKQYRQFPVILSEEESPSMEYTLGHKAKLIATFKDKVATHESKYDGSIEAKLNISFDLPQGTQVEGCLPATVNVNQSNSSLIAAVTVASGGTENYDVPFWIRNPDWLTLPTINVGDERFVGLYAVFENDADGNVIDINIDRAGQTIDYGDGTIIASVLGVNTHAYDYNALQGSILQMPDGTNYKMVIVDIDLNNTRYILCTSNSLPRSRALAGWLEITAAGSALETLRTGDNPAQNNRRYCLYLESLIVKEMSPTNTANQSCQVASILTNLKVLEYPNLNELENVLSASFVGSGDIRDSNGQPLSFNNTNFSGSLTVTFLDSSITELGDFIFPNVTAQVQCFYNSKIQEIGDIDLSSISSLFFFFALSDLRKVGTITVGTNLTTIRLLADDCYNVRKLIFAGDMSSVTNTANAFDNTWNLQELILPLMEVGFDISFSAITGTPLQDLFTSLGNANGAQTLILAAFTIGQSTTIATNKGYTIAYA